MKTRKQLLEAFSERLVSSLKKQGHGSEVAASGVKTKCLAKKLACSVQIARKYTLGEALPEVDQLIKLAAWLNVAPGWLLFGEETKFERKQERTISEILRYVLTRVAPLWHSSNKQEELIEFIIELVYDASHLKTDKKIIFKMLDMALMSVEKFQQNKNKKIV